MSERTYPQRLQDDEDHALRMCGLSLDAREDHDLEDFEYRHHDFKFFASGHHLLAHIPTARSGAGSQERDIPGRAVGPGPHSDHNDNAAAPATDAAAPQLRRHHDTEAHRTLSPHRRTRTPS